MFFSCCVIISTLIESRAVSAAVNLDEPQHRCPRCSLHKHAIEQGGQLVQRVLPRLVQPTQTRKGGIILAETRVEAHSSKRNSATEKMSRVGRTLESSKKLEDDENDDEHVIEDDPDEEELELVEEVENIKTRTHHINAERNTTPFYSRPDPRDFLSLIAVPVVSFLSQSYLGKWEDKEDEDDNEEGEAEETEGEEDGDGAEEEGLDDEMLQFSEEGSTGQKKRGAARRTASQRKKELGSRGQLSMIAGVMQFLSSPSGIVLLLASAFACVQVVRKRKQIEHVSIQLREAQNQLAENRAREKQLMERLADAYKANEISNQDLLPKAEAEKNQLVERIEQEKTALKGDIDNAIQSATARVAELETQLGQPVMLRQHVGEQQGRHPLSKTTPEAEMKPVLASPEPTTSSVASPLSVVGASAAKAAAPPGEALSVVAPVSKAAPEAVVDLPVASTEHSAAKAPAPPPVPPVSKAAPEEESPVQPVGKQTPQKPEPSSYQVQLQERLARVRAERAELGKAPPRVPDSKKPKTISLSASEEVKKEKDKIFAGVLIESLSGIVADSFKALSSKVTSWPPIDGLSASECENRIEQLILGQCKIVFTRTSSPEQTDELHRKAKQIIAEKLSELKESVTSKKKKKKSSTTR